MHGLHDGRWADGRSQIATRQFLLLSRPPLHPSHHTTAFIYSFMYLKESLVHLLDRCSIITLGLMLEDPSINGFQISALCRNFPLDEGPLHALPR